MTLNQHALLDQHILLTRATNKQASLSKLLSAQGAKTTSFPSLEIAPLKSCDEDYGIVKQQILDLDLFDIVICISANAANIAGELIDQYWPQLPMKIKWLAIGKATQEQLAYYDIHAQIMKGSDSEALLKHQDLQDVAGKKILIMQGNEGRKHLSNTLSNRSANITKVVLYNRLIPVYTDEEIKNSLYNSTLSAILITSGEAVCNLTTIARGNQQQFNITPVLKTLLIVPSIRVAEIASTQGYLNIKVAAGADDQSMLNTLLLVRGLEAENEKKK